MKNQEQQTRPRIYVACLAAYNAGQLHGEWINADRKAHEIYADIKSMLERSPEPSAEEWAVHDYEDNVRKRASPKGNIHKWTSG